MKRLALYLSVCIVGLSIGWNLYDWICPGGKTASLVVTKKVQANTAQRIGKKEIVIPFNDGVEWTVK